MYDGKSLYSKDEYKQMESVIDEIREDWVDSVFDCETKMECERWIHTISKKENNWIFDPEKVRTKVIEMAKLPLRYK